MRIQLKSEMIAAIGVKPLKEFGVDEDTVKWERDKSVDLTSYTKTQAKTLKAILEKVKGVRGTGIMVQDIDSWLMALDYKGVSKIRKLEHAPSMLKMFLKYAPKHWLYHRDEDTGHEQPYYLGNITYNQATEYSPASVTLSLYYKELGIGERWSVTLHHHDVNGKTPPEVLAEAGFFVENKDRLAAYNKSMIRYGKIFDKVGLQFLARGEASDNGVDGNKEKSYWYSSKTIILDRTGDPAHVVIDVLYEEDKKKTDRDSIPPTGFWIKQSSDYEGDEGDDDTDIRPDDVDDESPEEIANIPVSPTVVVFDLRRHLRLKIHVNQLEDYQYDTSLGTKLILPDEVRSLVDMLVANKGGFRDIIGKKGGGAIILCAGKPGTGKTLTAEVYSEAMSRPLYSVQCSQLGIKPDSLEAELHKIFARSQRWNAILLLDEADVYVSARGSDLHQNAIVGVFLRTLEYYSGVMFMTTNRADLVDDAIASRCLARIDYNNPTASNLKRIWQTLVQTSGANVSDKTIDKIVQKYPDMSGRDVKNLLKLSLMVSASTGEPITEKTVEFVKQFKPTSEGE